MIDRIRDTFSSERPIKLREAVEATSVTQWLKDCEKKPRASKNTKRWVPGLLTIKEAIVWLIQRHFRPNPTSFQVDRQLLMKLIDH